MFIAIAIAVVSKQTIQKQIDDSTYLMLRDVANVSTIKIIFT